ncbi:5-dehydro-4-deoxy-D-glucuronate isomerase [Jiulongibacter sediminis]|uniref:4-deoxy-L-threo-5-hexosulose-uronate ketol-isomerase n=1 Tax=Jiulongibacter sediminis TaxID=1605367 RepID=A0A0P7BJ83_9BACT|nr:5-dehydro-4-deoxy-D-glucuronate isomerase [Jiulongibacter sediminis]KPM47246.1 5-keto-4-deoxyuronate isomerase [Jiulongibacter sediminis]TBX22804.1 5-keto-4-deoxyuronate isomerase [Jiulongibacter sediminis]
MTSRYETSPREFERMNTTEMRAEFLVSSLFKENQVLLTHTHYDRMVTGGVMPIGKAVELGNPEDLKANFFLERRELGIINIGGSGTIVADGETYELEKLGCVYLGKGTQSVSFSSDSAGSPAKFFLLSTPAHKEYPNTLYTKEQALPVTLGDSETSNCRTIYKYIHNDGIMSCQLVMGLTVLQTGSVWNTMPPHTHDRRSEIYCYFDVPENQGVMHFMGKPDETRHLWVQNEQAIISPPWSIHAGSGTANYSFIWAMAGENKDFTDMDHVNLNFLR